MAGQRGERGYDAGKKVLGRKRHMLVDTCGHVLGVKVSGADVQDRDGAKLLKPFLLRFGWLLAVFVDSAYGGKLVQWAWNLRRYRHIRWRVIKKIHAAKFVVLPKRWVVERTFAWFNWYRRLAKDYEVHTAHSEGMIYLAAACILTRRLAKNHS